MDCIFKSHMLAVLSMAFQDLKQCSVYKGINEEKKN